MRYSSELHRSGSPVEAKPRFIFMSHAQHGITAFHPSTAPHRPTPMKYFLFLQFS
jgi:hypothetical protein